MSGGKEGVNVTVVEKAGHILSREEDEFASRLMDSLKAEGIEFLTETEVIKLAQQDGLIVTTVRDAQGGSSRISAESVLIAVGRRPNLEGIELEKKALSSTGEGLKSIDSFGLLPGISMLPTMLSRHISSHI